MCSVVAGGLLEELKDHLRLKHPAISDVIGADKH
jgi:hypothetical protein